MGPLPIIAKISDVWFNFELPITYSIHPAIYVNLLWKYNPSVSALDHTPSETILVGG